MLIKRFTKPLLSYGSFYVLTLLLYVAFVKVTLFFTGKTLSTTEESVLFFMYKSATLISVCFILYLFYDRKWKETFSRRLISLVEWKLILKGIGLIATINIGLFLILLVTGQASSQPENQRSIIEMFSHGFFWQLITVIFIAPLAEELFYRGFLMKFIGRFFEIEKKLKKWITLVVVSMLFAASHSINLFSFDFVIYFSLGFILGLSYWKTKRIEVPILIHMLNNALSFLIMLI
ncbi:CPBP family intramembrane metalloprotease [Listeria monocytogenes]|nr:CPBP family intramembrane metalloprotease [Listeria monocytogenes]